MWAIIFFVSLVVRHEGCDCANISGRIDFVKDKKTCEFHIPVLKNLGVVETSDYKKVTKNEKYVPGLVGATIKQLLTNGGIDKWVSSAGLSDGAKKMYGSLSDDGELMVKKNFLHRPSWITKVFKHDGDTMKYEVTKKPASSEAGF